MEPAVSERVVVDIDRVSPRTAAPLVERMDPAIGEATSVMGALLTELMRRTLRGGVAKVGEELDGFVAERVDATIEDRRPVLEQVAAEAADKSARVAATEVAVGEVRALEERTREADQGLAGRIDETAERSRRETEEAAQRLTGEIVEAERRVGDAVRSEVNGHVQDFVERARRGTAVLKARIQSVGQAAAALGERLQGEQRERQAALAAVRAEVGEQAAAVRHQLEKAAAERRAAEGVLRQELDRLAAANRALAARVAELEKPRGLRALWLRVRGLFGGRKQAPAVKEESPPAE
jgi:hypothetical protein